MHLVDIVNPNQEQGKNLGQIIEETRRRAEKFELWSINRGVVVLLFCLIYIDVIWLISLAAPLLENPPLVLRLISYPFLVYSFPLTLFGYFAGFPFFLLETYFIFSGVSLYYHRAILKD